MAGLGAAESRGMNGSLDGFTYKMTQALKHYEALELVHDHVLDDLKNIGMGFVIDFKSTMCAEPPRQFHVFKDGSHLDWKGVFLPRRNGRTILHQVIELGHGLTLAPDVAKNLTESLVQRNPMIIADREHDNRTKRNALELAVSCEKSCQNCFGIIKAICEHGMVHVEKKPAQEKNTNGAKKEADLSAQQLRAAQASAHRPKRPGERVLLGEMIPQSNVPSSVATVDAAIANAQAQKPKQFEKDGEIITVKLEWEELMYPARDNCLHTAIRDKKTTLARYLLERMYITEEQESILRHYGEDVLTPLHRAVEYNECSDDRVELVKYIIDIYPKALILPSGNSSPNTQTLEDHDGGPQLPPSRNEKRVISKEGLTPYKYFLESLALEDLGKGVESLPLAPETFSAASKMKELLRLSCMRHHGQNRALITKLLSTQDQIHLDLNPRAEVTQQFFNYMDAAGAEINFESYLQYVYIPNLRVHNVKNVDLEAETWWESSGRKDYVYIFRWLKVKKSVKRILSIVVEDDPIDFHSDEAIEEAVKDFHIEVWDWVKLDICSDTILAAAKNVRDLTLYWSGNRAILKSWAASDGLAMLEELETIRIMTPESIESSPRTVTTRDDFHKAFERAWKNQWKGKKPPKVEIETVTKKAHVVKKLSEKEREEKGRKERWLQCTEAFAQTLKKYMNNCPADTLKEDQFIKVAIIDDGVDADKDNIGENIADGETFYDSKGHWPGYYQSGYGHGHRMACLIQQLCPKVRLYIAKLNELWRDGKSQITAESAAKAIHWAREKEVDIISMSWTIETPKDSAGKLLTDAVTQALEANILLFCASNDQGNLTRIPYPASIDKRIFMIGSATALGKADDMVQGSVMFIAPGSDEVNQIMNGEDLGFAKPRIGSSIATARCAGLAALILQCVMLKGSYAKKDVRTFDNMRSMFMRLVDVDSDGDNKPYLRVWNVLEEAKTKAELGTHEEWNIINTAAAEFTKSIKWGQQRVGGSQPFEAGALAYSEDIQQLLANLSIAQNAAPAILQRLLDGLGQNGVREG